MNRNLMKKILITSCLVVSTTHAETVPVLVSRLIPQNAEMISYAMGDLNQDKLNDIALLIKPKNHDISGPKLFIYFNQNKTYVLQLSKNFDPWIYENEKECIGSAFDESSLTINRHTLNLNFIDEPICTNTYGINYAYKFKYNHSHFRLIGFDSFSADKISGNVKNMSINYLSNKIKIYQYNLFPDKKMSPKTLWKDLKMIKQYSLENMTFDNDVYNFDFNEQYK